MQSALVHQMTSLNLIGRNTIILKRMEKLLRQHYTSRLLYEYFAKIAKSFEVEIEVLPFGDLNWGGEKVDLGER